MIYTLRGQNCSAEVAEAHLKFFDPTLRNLSDPLGSKVSALPTGIMDVCATFQANLDGAIKTVSMPCNMAFSTALMNLQDKYLQESLVALAPPDGITADPDVQNEAERQSRARFDSILPASDHLNEALTSSLVDLNYLGRQKAIRESAPELLSQGIVLVWGTFEVLASDLFGVMINLNVTFAKRVLSDAKLKARFEIKSSDLLDLLVSNAFDLSGNLEQLLPGKVKIDDIFTIRDIYKILFPNSAALQTQLASDDLRVLEKRRHLIAHRRGVADAKYVSEVIDGLTVGQSLTITPGAFVKAVDIIRDSGIALLDAAAQELLTL